MVQLSKLDAKLKILKLMLELKNHKHKVWLDKEKLKLDKQIHDDKMVIEIEKLERGVETKETDTPTTIIFTDD